MTETITPTLRERAEAAGLPIYEYFLKFAHTLRPDGAVERLESSYGMLAKYGPGPSAEDIAEIRREMFGS